MDKVIGSCSNCGGDVIAHDGPWHAVVPPPPPRCLKCGAVGPRHTIQMGPPAHPWSGHGAQNIGPTSTRPWSPGDPQNINTGVGQSHAFVTGMKILSEQRTPETEYDRGYRDGLKSARLTDAGIPMMDRQSSE